MRASLVQAHDQKHFAAPGFLLFCLVSACVVGAINAPGMIAAHDAPAGTAAHSVSAVIADINRINKGDRLTTPLIQQATQRISPVEAPKVSLQRPPVGCDPAFSAVADPTRAAIYRRCAV
jgi:hypothetical protein